MTEPTYTAEQQRCAAKAILLRRHGRIEEIWVDRCVHDEGELVFIQAALTAAEEREKEFDSEIGRWQKAIYELCVRAAGGSIDGGGCDSGDPLDFTLAEVSQALGILEERADTAKAQLAAIRDAPLPEMPRIHTIEMGSGYGERRSANFFHYTEVLEVFTTLTQQNKALKLELTGKIKASSSEPRQRFDDVKD